MYYHYDALGNVTDLTDRLGENVVKYRWDAFGGMFAGVLAPYSRMGITGKEYDPKTGLAFFGSRWYNPMVGQFIMPDTFMGQLNKPQSLNTYAYAWNNPVNRIDPTGHWVDNSDGTYTAESGDTLWGLAEQTTGDGSNWTNLGYDGTPENLQVGETIGTSSGGTSSGGTSSGGTSSGGTSSGGTSSGDASSGDTSSNGGGSSGSGYSGGDDYTPPPPPPPPGGSIPLPAIVNDTNQGTSNANLQMLNRVERQGNGIVITEDEKKLGVKVVTIDGKQYYDYSEPINTVFYNAGVEASTHKGDLNWFKSKVNHKADWDIKRKEPWEKTVGTPFPGSYDTRIIVYESFTTPEELGNIMYGYTGTAAEISETVLIGGSMYAAGIWKIITDKNERTNEFNDHTTIRKGIQWYKEK